MNFHPITAADALDRWDEGKTVFTIEMGGLGPGYEQAIQVLVFEIVRDYLGKEQTFPPEDSPEFADFSSKFGDETVHRINKKMGGFSGAQVGAAKQIAYRGLVMGWEAMIKSIPQDRLIQVSKSFPVLTS